MSKKIDVYTETMAKVYADQGHWAKAAEIYRCLLAKEPERHDLAEALTTAEEKMDEIPPPSPDQLVHLLREWIELLFKYEKLQKLRNLKNRL